MEIQPSLNKIHKDLSELLIEFRGAGKRYTCYPPPSRWEEKVFTSDTWGDQFLKNYDGEIGVDLYLHIPFCKSLCTFCGCNIKITNNHELEGQYIEALLKEWSFYKNLIPEIKINSIYLGGGTPNFLSDENLETLLSGILFECQKTINFYGTYEADPRFIRRETLAILKRNNISRISFGVQDLDEKVLLNVNRIQSFEEVKNAISLSREMGMTEVLLDFIYGLHFQNENSLAKTFSKIKELKPEAVSFYPLAEAPWQLASQQAFGFKRPFDFKDKNKLFLIGHEELLENDYTFLGMGHYVSKNSPQQGPISKNKIHRNIMGFFGQISKQIIGLGVSSISFSGEGINQNEKILDKYEFQTQKFGWNSFRGVQLTPSDKLFIESINKIICEKELDLSPILSKMDPNSRQNFFKKLKGLENNNLIERKNQFIKLRENGIHFFDFILNQIEESF